MGQPTKREKRIRPSDNTASRFIAPPAMVRIANDRTSPIRRAWAAEIAWKPADLAMLAESCYMQGVNDTIQAAITHGWIPRTAASQGSPDGETPQADPEDSHGS